MTIDIIMPQMGESVVEGTIVRWLAKEGDKIQKDQPIVEISTDKVDTEVPSPTSGILKHIIHKEEDTVPVKTVIATLEEMKAEVASFQVDEEVSPTKEEKAIQQNASIARNTVELREKKRLSPLVRRMAREHKIDLSKVQGTGIGGRITKNDLLAYIKPRPEYVRPVAAGEETEAKETVIPVSPKRRIIAERMSESMRTAAHVTTTFEVDMTKIAGFRNAHKDSYAKDEHVKLTFLPFIILNTALALKQHPVFNSSWSDEGIVLKRDINIGIAVSLNDGLIVPVIKNADRKDLPNLARESQDIAQRARDKRLGPDEVKDGTFTITNYGANGSLFGTPIILLPQVAILGVGTIAKRPVVINDAIAIRHMVYLSLSFDHRVVDGAQADQFLINIKERLEGWGENVFKENPDTETGFGGVW